MASVRGSQVGSSFNVGFGGPFCIPVERPGSGFGHRGSDLVGVGVLLKARGFPILDLPNVGELGVDFGAGRLVLRRLPARYQHNATGVEEAFDVEGPVVPRRAPSHGHPWEEIIEIADQIDGILGHSASTVWTLLAERH